MLRFLLGRIGLPPGQYGGSAFAFRQLAGVGLSLLQYRQAAGRFAEAVIRSVELIAEPAAKDPVGEMGVRGGLSTGRGNGALHKY